MGGIALLWSLQSCKGDYAKQWIKCLKARSSARSEFMMDAPLISSDNHHWFLIALADSAGENWHDSK